ncbi:MAG TPA: NAD-dependent epimerase/dehydratase family protein [Rhizomicrobium sp.]|nr:NAD-dependent epimerase/dehydratase family protein [Rhizomicrobium sp.]
MRRVLVTGARGYIGAHLVSALGAMGTHVTALVRSAGALPAGVRGAEGDVLDGAALTALLAAERYDAIFHLAGLNAGAGSAAVYQTNVIGTATLLQAVRALGQPKMRVVLVGSSAEYGASPDDPLTEESPTVPVGDYGVSKLAATQMGRVLHSATGQDTVMVRPFNVIGPGACAGLLHAEVARQIVEIEQGKRAPVLKLRDLSGYRDFVDARDVAGGLVALAQRGLPGQVYNLCTERAVQAATLVERLVGNAHAHLTIEAEHAPRKFGDVSYQRGSFQKAKNTAGWAPSIGLEKSLTDTLNYWRKWGNTALSGGQVSEAISK